MSSLLKAYMTTLHRHPLKTQTVTTGVLMAAGDVIYQVGFENKTSLKTYDFHKTTAFFGVGLCLGPVLGVWFRFLETKFPSTPRNLVKKLVIDQTFAAPTVLFGLLSSLTFTTTFSIEKTKQKLRDDYFSALKNSYKLWPAVQMINFYFTPLNYRVLVVCVVSLFWNTYLAYKTST